MSWVLYCLGAVVVWAVVNILDKFVMSKEAKDAYLAAAVSV